MRCTHTMIPTASGATITGPVSLSDIGQVAKLLDYPCNIALVDNVRSLGGEVARIHNERLSS